MLKCLDMLHFQINNFKSNFNPQKKTLLRKISYKA